MIYEEFERYCRLIDEKAQLLEELAILKRLEADLQSEQTSAPMVEVDFQGKAY